MINAIEFATRNMKDKAVSYQIADFFREYKTCKFISASYAVTFNNGLSYYAMVIYDDGE